MFATPMSLKQRATKTATARVSFCHMKPRSDCVSGVYKAETATVGQYEHDDSLQSFLEPGLTRMTLYIGPPMISVPRA